MKIKDCAFCLLDNHGYPIYSITPLNPIVPGHLLFIPSEHYTDAADDLLMTGRVFAIAAQWAKHQESDFNLITSSGSNATQTVFHFHVHYIPRSKDDGLTLPWTGQVK